MKEGEAPGQMGTSTNIHDEHMRSLRGRVVDNELLDAAIDYATRLEWPVFPTMPGQKNPLTAHGHLDATTDEVQIMAWWRKTPEANIATPTGVVFDVIDVEMEHLDAFLQSFGDPTRYPCVRTPSGGLHVYVAVTRLRCQKTKFGDFKGKGGYVLLPPSVIKGSLYHDYKGLD